ncbi:MAG: recombinase family protein [Candidatus Daviesbacteria bacterium]|nr:recombinase family protein [Candidatus Daviesbacteria bacterium]
MQIQTLNNFDYKDSLQLVNNTTIIPTWIQARVSTKSQIGQKTNGIFEEKASLPEQQNNCLEAIANYKGRCSKCSKEIRLIHAGTSLAKGESGQNLDREDTEEFLRLAQEGKFQVLITNDNDRLSRARSTGVVIRDTLNKIGVQIYSLSQPLPLRCPSCFDRYDNDVGIITETISDLKSQLDVSKIRRNYKIGMPKRIERGKPPGSLGYGLMRRYETIGQDSRGSDIQKTYYEWDLNKVAIVKRIAREYMAGKGVWAICKDLNDEGIPSPQGKEWGRSVLPVILKNPIYAGWVRWGWKTTKNGERKIQPRENWIMHKAQFDGIWDDDYDEKLQAEIKRRATIGGRTLMSKALLIGILKCGYCNYSMFQIKSRRTFKNGTKYLWRGYGCGSFLHKATCRHNGKLQKVVDDLVLKEVLKLANDKTRKAYLEKVNKLKTDNRGELYELKEREFKRRIDEFGRINTAYKEGVDSLAEYKKNKEELLPILENLQKELISLNAQANTPIIKLDWDKQYKSILSKFIESPAEEDVPTIRKILVSLIDKIAFKSKPLSIKIFYKTTT